MIIQIFIFSLLFFYFKASLINVNFRADIKKYSKNENNTNINPLIPIYPLKEEGIVQQKPESLKGKWEVNSLSDNSDLFNNYISNLLEILQNSFLLSILISILLLLILAFLFFKFIANKDYKFNWIKKLYFGDKIHYFIMKILALWGKTSLLWVFLGLIFIIIVNLFNSFFLFYLLNEFKNIFRK